MAHFSFAVKMTECRDGRLTGPHIPSGQ